MDITIGTDAAERKDDRRNQRYYRTVTAYASADLDGHEIEGLDVFGRYGEEHERYFGTKLRGDDLDTLVADLLEKRLFAEEIQDHCVSGKTTKVRTRLSSNRRKRWDETPYVTIHVSYRVPAIRPSEIVSEEEALALIDTEELEARLKGAVESALEFLEKRAAQLNHLSGTNQLAEWIATTAQERAVEKTKFEARVSALREEFEARVNALKAEAKQQTIEEGRAIAAEWEEKHIPECIEGGFSKESAEAATDFWDRYVEAPKGGFLSRRGHVFGTSPGRPEPKVKPEDLGFTE